LADDSAMLRNVIIAFTVKERNQKAWKNWRRGKFVLILACCSNYSSARSNLSFSSVSKNVSIKKKETKCVSDTCISLFFTPSLFFFFWQSQSSYLKLLSGSSIDIVFFLMHRCFFLIPTSLPSENILYRATVLHGHSFNFSLLFTQIQNLWLISKTEP